MSVHTWGEIINKQLNLSSQEAADPRKGTQETVCNEKPKTDLGKLTFCFLFCFGLFCFCLPFVGGYAL